MKTNSWIMERIFSFKDNECLVFDDQIFTYQDLYNGIISWNEILDKNNIKEGEIVSFIAENKPEILSLMYSLILNKNILVPLSADNEESHGELNEIAEVTGVWQENDKQWIYKRTNISVRHEMLVKQIDENEAGLILFTSGSTGKPKAALHKLSALMNRYQQSKRELSLKTLLFLKLFHIGGIHTLFSFTLNGGTIVLTPGRSPEDICRAVEKHKIELLPTTPTFLNMLILSNAYEKYNLSSIQTITYGAEPMPNATLITLAQLFPNIKLKQTYGFTELGILSTKSKSSDSLWIQINKKNTDFKIVDNILFVKNNSSMMGYLNAPSPIDASGWFNTGDLVEVDGDYLKILGRQNELINVGGEKVFPAQVENVLLQMDEVREVIVSGKKNPITGSLVTATIIPNGEYTKIELIQKIRAFCKGRLEDFEIPRLIYMTNTEFVGLTGKKKRIMDQEVESAKEAQNV